MNVLILYSDQHRCDCLGAYGNAQVRTPNLDALASDGVRFDNSFCPFPVCTPSRYSFLSGLYVRQHGGWTNHSTLRADIPTFPRVLREAGWRTKAVGKMHFTPTYLDVGFEEMLLAEQNGPGRWDDDYHRFLMDRGLVDFNDLEDQEADHRRLARPEYWETVGALPSNLPEEAHSTTWVAQRAIEEIAAWGGGENLLMVGFIKPHHPFDPPRPWDGMYDPASIALLPGWTEACLETDLNFAGAYDPNTGYFPHRRLTEAQVRRATAFYYATISHMDHHIGRILNALKGRGLYDDTLVIYTSDHGDYMGFHHMLLKGNRMYDPLVRVPLLVKWPRGRMERSGADAQSAHSLGRSAALVSAVDLAPTILNACGVPIPSGMRGIPIAGGQGRREFVFAESRRGSEIMVRSEGRKLLLSENDAEGMFFDIASDPHELDNRIGDPACRDEIERLRAAARAWMSGTPRQEMRLDETAPRIAGPNVPPLDDGHRERVRAYFTERMETMRRTPAP